MMLAYDHMVMASLWWKRDHIEGERGEEEEEEGKWRKRRVGLDKLV